MMFRLVIFIVGLSMFISCDAQELPLKNKVEVKHYNVEKTEAEWKEVLSAEEYRILREKGTEYPFSGAYNDHYEKGIYKCAACGYSLFESSQKFDSHSGWPSFANKLAGDRVVHVVDNSLNMKRIEIVCGNCGGHLGHLFDDGPTETGLRYCVNSISLKFTPAETK